MPIDHQPRGRNERGHIRRRENEEEEEKAMGNDEVKEHSGKKKHKETKK